MPTSTTSTSRVSISLPVEELAQTLWRLPKRKREALEDVLEERFVKTVLRRAKDIPRLKRKKKLLSLDDLEKEFFRP